MLIAYLPTSGIQTLDNFPKFPGFYQISLDRSIQFIHIYYVIFKTLRCKNGELEYQVKMEDTNYDAKIFGRRTRVRMTESQ